MLPVLDFGFRLNEIFVLREVISAVTKNINSSRNESK